MPIVTGEEKYTCIGFCQEHIAACSPLFVYAFISGMLSLLIMTAVISTLAIIICYFGYGFVVSGIQHL